MDNEKKDYKKLYKDIQRATQKYINCLRIANKKIGELIEENYYLKEQKPSTPEDIAVAYQMGLAKGRNEQKPVKLNDDTEVGLDRALQIVKHAKGNLEGYQSDDGIYECDHAIQTLERILKNGVEQNPAEWSDEDKHRLEQAINALSRNGYYILVDWLKLLPEKFNTQPKQEWSEEDERKIVELKTFIAQCNGFNKENRKKAFDMIDALRPKPKQESEPLEIKYAEKIYKVYGTKELPGGVVGYIIEDEPGHYDCIINPEEVLGGGYGVKQNGSPYPTKETTFDYPHWKPSEEQMKCLEDCVKKARDIYNACNMYTSRYDAYPTLNSLLHDLKNLM